MQPNSWDIESFILSDPTVFFNNFFVSNFSWIAADLCGGHGRCLLAQQCVNHIKPWGLCHFCPKWGENNLCYNADSLDCLDTLTWKPWRHVQPDVICTHLIWRHTEQNRTLYLNSGFTERFTVLAFVEQLIFRVPGKKYKCKLRNTFLRR